MSKKQILGLIPARYGSTRFPGKPLADIGGKTMIQRVYEQAKKQLEHVYVATDDDRIKDAVVNFGGKVIMTDEGHQSGTDRCAEALEKVQKIENLNFDAVINIQGDEPFVSPDQIKLLTDCFNDDRTELATLAKIIKEETELFDANKPKVIMDKNDNAIYFSRLPIPFFRGKPEKTWVNHHKYYSHIGLYGYRSDILQKITQLSPSSLELSESLEQLRWIENGYTIKVKETDQETISIDTKEDLQKLISKGLI